MAVELGRAKFGFGQCNTLEDVIEKLQLLDDALGNPTVPTDSTVDTVDGIVYYDDGDLVLIDGTTIAGTDTYTAGCGISVASNVISAAVDGTTIICSGGVLSATAAATAYTATAPIVISGSNVISVSLGDGLWKDGDDEAAVRLATESGLEFDGNDPGRLRDKWRYHGIYGTTTTALEDVGGGGVNLTSCVETWGEDPGASISASTGPNLWAPADSVIYLRPSTEGGSDKTDQWDTGDARNFPFLVAGLGGFDESLNMLIGHAATDLDVTLAKWDEISDWLKLLQDYVSGAATWQVIGAGDGSDSEPKWVGMPAAVLGTADTAVTSANSTFDITVVTVLHGPASDIPGTLTVNNHFEWDIDEGGKVKAERAYDGSGWYATQAQCPG